MGLDFERVRKLNSIVHLLMVPVLDHMCLEQRQIITNYLTLARVRAFYSVECVEGSLTINPSDAEGIRPLIELELRGKKRAYYVQRDEADGTQL